MDGEDGPSLVTEEEWVLDYLLAATAAPATEPALLEPAAPSWLGPLLAGGAVSLLGLAVLVARRRRFPAVAT